MKKINLSAYHPILDIQDHIVFANNGNVVLGYQVDNPEIYSLAEKILRTSTVRGFRRLNHCLLQRLSINRTFIRNRHI